MDQLGEALQRVAQPGYEPVLLTTAGLRRPLRQIALRFFPELAVISYAELGSSGEVDVLENADSLNADSLILDKKNRPACSHQNLTLFILVARATLAGRYSRHHR